MWHGAKSVSLPVLREAVASINILILINHESRHYKNSLEDRHISARDSTAK
jgi:hypothetical protein